MNSNYVHKILKVEIERVINSVSYWTQSRGHQKIRDRHCLTLDCGHKVYRRPKEYTGHHAIRCEWCQSGEQPQEVAQINTL